VASALAIVRKVRGLQALQQAIAKERARKMLGISPTKKASTAEAREIARLEAKASGRRAPVFAKYKDDPCGFARDVLHLELWSKQREVLDAFARSIASSGKLLCAVRSGHKVGKSTLAVVAALWWACTRPRARVFLTAPSAASQIRNILWKELRRIMLQPGVAVAIGVFPAIVPSTGMQWPDGREIIGVAAEDAEALAGLSGPEVMWIVDEASGYPQSLFEAVHGNRAADSPMLLIGNPTKNAGEFYDAFHKNAGLYLTFHIRSDQTPNITGLEPAVPGLASKRWLSDMEIIWQRGSRRWRIRVEGEFGDGDAEGALWKRHMIRHVDEVPPLKRVLIAIDPAVTSDEDSSNETGIIAVGLGHNLHGYVLDDASGIYTPEKWGEAALDLAIKVDADAIVGEVNQGGDLIESNIRAAGRHVKDDPRVEFERMVKREQLAQSVRVIQVRATRGKAIRAEPVATLYARGQVHHVGHFHALEDQLCTWEPISGEDSPDRLDADVWGLTELMLKGRSGGVTSFGDADFSGG
jgi:phage terminase large subunit-like protein